jgi:hypothetical protein
MSIKQHLENALQGIYNEKNRAEAIERERVMREVVAPHNAEIDTALNAAIAEITDNLNQSIAAMQNRFASQKQSLIEQSAKKKADYENNAVAQAVAVVSVTYDSAIAKLKKQIEDIKE